MNIFRLHKLWLTSLWVLRGQNCHFALHQCEHLAREPHTETWGCQSQRWIRLQVNMWHPLAMNHIKWLDKSKHINNTTMTEWLAAAIQSYDQRSREGRKNTTEEPLPLFQHFNILGPHFFLFLCEVSYYSHPKWTKVTFSHCFQPKHLVIWSF